MSDSIIKEVRRAREQHAASMGYDLDRIYDSLKAGERKRSTEGWAIVPPPSVPPPELGSALQRTRFACR